MTPNIAMSGVRRAAAKSMQALLAALSTTLLAAAVSIDSGNAQERYPSRPVKIVVPYPAGGPATPVAHLVANKLGTALGGNFYIENVPGAAGSLGARAVGGAPPDGYTLLVMTQDFAVQPLIKASTPYDAVGGFVPVSLWRKPRKRFSSTHRSRPRRLAS